MELAGAVLAVVLLLAAVGVAGAVVLLRRLASGRRRDNQVVPGAPTSAPPAWAGAHTAEARLHRRLRDAVRAVRAGDAGAAGDPTVADLRRSLEQEALAIDARLVAVAALPERVRTVPLQQVRAAVEALEDASARLAIEVAGAGTGAPAGGVEEVTQRLRHLAEARAELDRVAPDPGAGPTRQHPRQQGST